MKRYLVFSGANYYPLGGWEDLKSSHDTIPDAIRQIQEDIILGLDADSCDWGQIADIENGIIIGHWEYRLAVASIDLSGCRLINPLEPYSDRGDYVNDVINRCGIIGDGAGGKLVHMIKIDELQVAAERDGGAEVIDAEQLVVGDVFEYTDARWRPTLRSSKLIATSDPYTASYGHPFRPFMAIDAVAAPSIV